MTNKRPYVRISKHIYFDGRSYRVRVTNNKKTTSVYEPTKFKAKVTRIKLLIKRFF